MSDDYKTAPHYVYELYAADDLCLYVGCSSDIGKRLDSHRLLRDWWPDVRQIWVTYYSDYESGADAERQRIAALNPRHNTIHTDHDHRGGGWATRRANARARHERGEVCAAWHGCIECNNKRSQTKVDAALAYRARRRRSRTQSTRKGAA